MLERRLHLSIFASHHVVMLHHLEAVLLFQQFSLIHTSSSEYQEVDDVFQSNIYLTSNKTGQHNFNGGLQIGVTRAGMTGSGDPL